jgi:diguanylate cyclase (GGDEF)-like protein/PAS domain S-box-containing protein
VTLDAIVDGVIRTDVRGGVEFINPAAARLTGWTLAEALGKPLDTILQLSDDRSGTALANVATTVVRDDSALHQLGTPVLHNRLSGVCFHIELRAAPVRDQLRGVIGTVVVFHDITEIQRLTHQLAYQASHDALTELSNRAEFETRVAEALVDAQRHHHQHVLCYLDLDQFKVVNDTCGHAAGDELLRQLAQQLGMAVGKDDLLARLGGDEFGILLRNCTIARGFEFTNGLCSLVKDFRFNWKGKIFQVGVSAGLVAVDAATGTLAEALSCADSACYVAKEQGRNRVHVFRPDDSALAQRKGQMQWVQRLKRALDEERFCLYSESFLPLSVRAADIAPHEILLRMVDEEGREIAPMAFIPAAERYQLMTRIDRWVITRTFSLLAKAQQRSLATANTPRQVFALNLSGQSLSDDGFLGFVVDLLDHSGLAPESICFEITETAAIANLARASRLITILKGMGCLFALDDFGSGLSSFAYLRNLPVDFLKIDGSFVLKSLNDPVDYAMVDAINRLGHLMGLRTIAEHVHHRTLLDRIKALGVDYAQGHSLGVAQPLEVELGLVTSSTPLRVVNAET